MRISSFAANLLLAFVIFLGGQLLSANQSAAQSHQTQPEGPRLHLRAGAFDPLDLPTPDHPTGAIDGSSLNLVQFNGPIQDSWLAAMKTCGLAVVSYIPDYAYLVWGEAAAVDCLEQAAPLRWRGPYQPAYALHPSLAAPVEAEKPAELVPRDVIVQLYETPETPAALRSISKEAMNILRQPKSYLGYRVLAVRLPAESMAQIAALPGVVNIEPLPRYQLQDEIQGQIMAGNLTDDGAQPSGPGYLDWLTGLGFSTHPEDYPIVDVTDDGIDDGSETPLHSDFYQFGDPAQPDRLAYNANWTSDLAADGLDGHGNLNASIVAGYNDETGAAFTDESGYHYGLGINPFGRVAGSKIFSSYWGWDLPNDDFAALVAGSYLNGARISTNSWGSYSYGSYTWADQVYDSLVRDAISTQSGNQEITIVFSAGNAGSYSSTIGSPGNAKNVITVGAAENYRPTWTDGCYVPPEGADNANDIIDFSSRGPTADGRTKPDLVAPGTHIQGAASQVTGYTGYAVCDRYHPPDQTLYAASSGTSHSAPAVAGAASLFYNYYQQNFSADPPSPAMVKAYLANTARYLNGIGANDTLPSNSQGHGEVDLGMAFDGLARTLVDQQNRLSESGQLYAIESRVINPAQPVRVTLAWTDAPGVPYAAAYVNNLDLEVEVNGQTYLGNVFNGAFSTTGGQADGINNLESVFLPAGHSGLILVRVRASNIAGDGVPGDSDPTDQDFALVIYNGAQVIGYLQGSVTDSESGEGIPGAMVQASGENWDYLATADSTGVYTLPLPVNTYAVSAWKTGYTQEFATGVVVNENQVTTQDFSLDPAGSHTLQGCVTDLATGQGLAASLSVAGPFGVPVAQAQTTRSDPCYQLDLYDASYRVVVESRLHYPGQAQVDLFADLVQDFALQATTLEGLLQGRVTDYNTGDPLSGVLLSTDPPSEPILDPYPAISDENGAYEIILPPDTYTVNAEKFLYSPLSVDGVIVPQSNVEQLDFALRSPRQEMAPIAPLRFDLQPGEQASATLSFSNTGSDVLLFLAYESSGNIQGVLPSPDRYVVLDNRVSPGVNYEWIDVSDGTLLDLQDDDETTVDLPFSFGFYGGESNVLRIGNNGAVLFDSVDGQVHYTNQQLSYATDNLIAPFWDDLDADYGWVAYKTVGEAPNRRFVVEWHNRPHYFYGNDGITFELILYEGSNNLKFQYQDVYFGDYYVNRGANATVGIRGTNRDYLEYSFNNPALTDGMALCFQVLGSLPCDVEDLPWLSVSPMTGSLDPLDAQSLTISVDSLPVGLGIHQGVVHMWSNDPLRQPYIEIPVRLVVHGFEYYFPYVMYFPQFVSPFQP
jgi:hypothetical protein